MRVLFPTDGSRQTEASFKNLLRLLAAGPGLEITGLVVRNTGMEEADPEIVDEFDEDERDEIFPTEAAGERAIHRLRELAEPFGVKVRGKVEAGNFQKVILRESENHDVLAMHEMSTSNLKDFFTGSKVEKLLRGARSPGVLLVRSDMEVPAKKVVGKPHVKKD